MLLIRKTWPLLVSFVSVSTVLATALSPAPASGFDEPLLAYDNYCQADELYLGDAVTIEGNEYEVYEDADGLYVAYEIYDENGDILNDGTLSIVEFSDDCETVHFEEVEGVDYLIEAYDVDE
jgi:hypothetical protein